MSELINVIVHKEHKRFQEQKKTHVKLKDYRASENGKAALAKAKTFTSQIMRLSTLQSGIFNPEEMKSMVSNCDKADFNDIYFAKFCEKQNAIMVTHDFDFGALD